MHCILIMSTFYLFLHGTTSTLVHPSTLYFCAVSSGRTACCWKPHLYVPTSVNHASSLILTRRLNVFLLKIKEMRLRNYVNWLLFWKLSLLYVCWYCKMKTITACCIFCITDSICCYETLTTQNRSKPLRHRKTTWCSLI